MANDSIGDQKTIEESTRRRETGGSLTVEQRFGEYRIQEFIGRGGMGEVYAAEHGIMGRLHALKLLLADLSGSQSASERFHREVRVLANLEHPCVVSLIFAGEARGRSWLALELIRGITENGKLIRNLSQLVRVRGGKLEQGVVADILVQVLEGLSCAHGRGVIHRDMKPANILIAGTGVDAGSVRVKISDFGLVRLVGEDWVRSRVDESVLQSMSLGDKSTFLDGDDETGTSTRSLLGTYAYMAPEQKRGKAADERSDIYSVGLMAFRFLTGQAEIDFNLPSSIDPGLDPAWDEIVKSACAVNPVFRFASAGDMLEAVRGIGRTFRRSTRVGKANAKSETVPIDEEKGREREKKPDRQKEGQQLPLKLRSEPQTMSKEDVKAMLRRYGFYDAELNKNGDFRNAFSSFRANSDGTITDLATGLIWEDEGSEEPETFSEAGKHVEYLNRETYYSDWRLPTLEELCSLIQNEKNTNTEGLLKFARPNQIDPFFRGYQTVCWSADKQSSGSAWFVNFQTGTTAWASLSDSLYVRAVRRLPQPGDIIEGPLPEMRFAWVPPGSFMMGSPEEEKGRYIDEVLHERTLSKGFYMQTMPVSQHQWKAVMDKKIHRTRWRGRDLPMENISWEDAQVFIRRLNEKTKREYYRLPSETEWEYACRAGAKGRFCFGNSDEELYKYAWYRANSKDTTQAVGQKKPNAWNLYDMHGNVWEWCEDEYVMPMMDKIKSDTLSPDAGYYRVIRGGCWSSSPEYTRCANRKLYQANCGANVIGFRIVKDIY